MLTIQEIQNKIQSISLTLNQERDEDLIKQMSETISSIWDSLFDRHFASKLNSEEWPAAADPMIICKKDSDEDKTMRASAIFSLLLAARFADGNGKKKFLDFGCGEGHIVQQVIKSNMASYAIGYDLEDFNWSKFPDLNLTIDVNKVKENGPYDLILLYDVLDHVTDDKQIEVLKLAKSFLAKNGKIVVRFHPWCSRHGTHMWDLNKAFAHVVFSSEELERMGHKGIYTVKVTHPSITYKQWIDGSDLKIINEKITSEQSGPIFESNKDLKARVIANCGYPSNHLPYNMIEQIWCDYVLESK